MKWFFIVGIIVAVLIVIIIIFIRKKNHEEVYGSQSESYSGSIFDRARVAVKNLGNCCNKTVEKIFGGGA